VVDDTDLNERANGRCGAELEMCTGKAGWCDCDGDEKKDDDELGWNCTELNLTIFEWKTSQPPKNEAPTCFTMGNCTKPASLLSISENLKALQPDENEWEYEY